MTTITRPSVTATTATALASVGTQWAPGPTWWSASVRSARRRSYSSERSSINSCSLIRPVKITGSIGNFSGRRWLLKKWIVKMKPAASRPSSPCTSSATLNQDPGRIREKNSGNHSIRPEPPITPMPQNTAQ